MPVGDILEVFWLAPLKVLAGGDEKKSLLLKWNHIVQMNAETSKCLGPIV